jgi:dihydroxy-acid dehydratase
LLQWAAIDEYRAGTINENGLRDVEEGIARSAGHCMTAGTASTMTACAEAMGLSLPGASSIPAVDAGHSRMATHSGRRIVEMVREGLKPSKIVTSEAMDNAITTFMMIGGSTNAIVHLTAIAGCVRFMVAFLPPVAQRRPNSIALPMQPPCYHSPGELCG